MKSKTISFSIAVLAIAASVQSGTFSLAPTGALVIDNSEEVSTLTWSQYGGTPHFPQPEVFTTTESGPQPVNAVLFAGLDQEVTFTPAFAGEMPPASLTVTYQIERNSTATGGGISEILDFNRNVLISGSTVGYVPFGTISVVVNDPTLWIPGANGTYTAKVDWAALGVRSSNVNGGNATTKLRYTPIGVQPN